MILKSLKLENIRSYSSANIDFLEGSTLLIGDIGSGKTTILLAIEFALFGIIKGDVSGASILRHGKKEGVVELDFELNGKNITIIRRLKQSKDSVTQDSGKLIIDGFSQDLTPIELKSKVLEMFGYPEDLLNKNTSIIYRYTVYTPQEDMKKILFDSKEERLDILRKIFNIDRYKRIRENALVYAKDLRNTKKIIESKISDLDILKKSLEESNNSKDNYENILSTEKKSFDEIEKKKSESLASLKVFEDKIIELNILKKDFDISKLKLKSKIAEIDSNTKELSIINYRIVEYNSKLSELGIENEDENTISLKLSDAEDKFSKIKNAKEVINKRLEDKERDLKNMESQDLAALKYKKDYLSKKLENKDDVQKTLDKLKDEFEHNLIELNIINSNKKNSSKIVDQMKDLSTCPVCLQEVDFSHKVKILDKENSSIQMFERKMKEMQDKKTELSNQILNYNSQISEMQKMEIELNIVNTKISNAEKMLEQKNNLVVEIEELKGKKERLDKMDINILLEIISKARKQLTAIEAKKHIEESLKEKLLKKIELEEKIRNQNQELTVLKDDDDKISNKIKSFEDLEKEYNTKKSDYEQIQKIHTEKLVKIATIQKDLENTKSKISKLIEDIDNKNKLKEKVEYISELNYWIGEHIINLASTIEKSVMQKIHREFSELFQKWFNILIDDENILVRIDQEFTPQITQDGFDTEIISLSGGEKTSVALAYRLALNKVINDMISTISTKDILILDEPTDGFSTQQLDRMRNVLYELDLKQLIMVSHEAKMESYVDNVIRVNKNEHLSQIY